MRPRRHHFARAHAIPFDSPGAAVNGFVNKATDGGRRFPLMSRAKVAQPEFRGLFRRPGA